MSGLLTLEVEMIKNHFSDDTIFGVKKKKKKKCKEVSFHIALKMHSKCSKAIRKINKRKILQGKMRRVRDYSYR